MKKGFLVICILKINFLLIPNSIYCSDFGSNNTRQICQYLSIQKDGFWGVINLQGNILIKPTYDKIYIGGDNHQFLFFERNPNVKMGYLNYKGEYIWKPFR